MFARILKAKDLNALEKCVNDFIEETNVEGKKLKIANVQQFVVGEIDPGNISVINRAPVPTYLFCLLLICSYE